MVPLTLVPHWKHVYRSLLRESSYLPDPISREYMRKYVRFQYRYYWPKVIPNSVVAPFGQINLEARGRKLLSLLTRANEGYLKPLERVLMLSYGRTGKRRHVLLRPLLGLGTSSSNDGCTIPASQRKTFEPWTFPPGLDTLVKDQVKQIGVRSVGVRPLIKQATFKPPEKNSWGRPLSPSRIFARRRKWYLSTIDRVLPPLPDRDWNVLSGLMTGVEPWSEPQRRKRPVSDEGPQNALTAEFLIYGPKKGQTFEAFARGRPHHITLKLMRGLWGKVCEVTPRMTIHPDENLWDIKWGRPTEKPLPYRTLDPELGLALFEGVDLKTGEIPKAKKLNAQT